MTKRFITGTWNHIFEGEGRERSTRIVVDVETSTLVTALVQRNRASEGSFTLSTRMEAADIEDSLVNANPEVFDKPEDFGLEFTDELPAWA